jgi:hypothetical protein
LDAPDLVVSFRELPDVDNSGLTSPGGPAYVFDEQGERNIGAGSHSNVLAEPLAKVRAEPLVMPVKGVMYADTGGWGGFATGLGMHAAAGARELHNFCAAVGPDFRRHFADQYPSGNLDLRATIARVIDLAPGDDATSVGRPLDEALAGQQLNAATSDFRVTVSHTLPTTESTSTHISTTLDFSVLSDEAGRWSYLDGVEYKQARPTKSK